MCCSNVSKRDILGPHLIERTPWSGGSSRTEAAVTQMALDPDQNTFTSGVDGVVDDGLNPILLLWDVLHSH